MTTIKPQPAQESSHTVSLPKLMNEEQASEYTGLSKAWFQRARWAGEGPKFVRLGRSIRYRADHLDEWINNNTQTPTAIDDRL